MKFTTIKEKNLDESAPLLYLWEIRDSATGESIGRYLGKAKGGSQRPLEHYSRNVRRLLIGAPYRKSKPHAYRTVHHALKDAVISEHQITLTLIRNVSPEEDINKAERDAIVLFNCNLNG
jgi:hypothetical protein